MNNDMYNAFSPVLGYDKPKATKQDVLIRELQEAIAAYQKNLQSTKEYVADLNNSLLQQHQEIEQLKIERNAALETAVEIKQAQPMPFERTESLKELTQTLFDNISINDHDVVVEMLENSFEYIPNSDLTNFITYTLENDIEVASECCGAKVVNGLCTECKEHI